MCSICGDRRAQPRLDAPTQEVEASQKKPLLTPRKENPDMASRQKEKKIERKEEKKKEREMKRGKK
jgi:hypothetical protein